LCFEKKRNLRGIIRYFGPVHFDTGIWYGLELDEKNGANNGTVKNKYYFECRADYGLFILPRKTEPESPTQSSNLQNGVNGTKKKT